jgi:2-polyprenyl-6-methoxyphenol hydroxylase-like FAD-dependent oxidoreductase
MDRPVRNILVVGGGTAGWLSAAYLQRALGGDDPPVAVTLVESPSLGSVGVGESTLPSLRETLRYLDVDESDWLVAADRRSSWASDSWIGQRTGANSGTPTSASPPSRARASCSAFSRVA